MLQSPKPNGNKAIWLQLIRPRSGWPGPSRACCPLLWAPLRASPPLERSGPGRMRRLTGLGPLLRRSPGHKLVGQARQSQPSADTLEQLLPTSTSSPLPLQSWVLGPKGPVRPLSRECTPLSPLPPPLARERVWLGRMDNRSPYPSEVTRNQASLVSRLSYSFLIRGCPPL